MNTTALAGSTSVITTNAPSIPLRVPTPLINNLSPTPKSLSTTAGGGDNKADHRVDSRGGSPTLHHNGGAKLYKPTPTTAAHTVLHPHNVTHLVPPSLHNHTSTTSVISSVTSVRSASTSMPSTPMSSAYSSSLQSLPTSAPGSDRPSPVTSSHGPDTPSTPSSDHDCDNKSATPLGAYSKNTASPWGR